MLLELLPTHSPTSSTGNHMQKLYGLSFAFISTFSACVSADNLPKVTGLELNDNQLSWDAQEGASGYNIPSGLPVL